MIRYAQSPRQAKGVHPERRGQGLRAPAACQSPELPKSATLGPPRTRCRGLSKINSPSRCGGRGQHPRARPPLERPWDTKR